MWPNEKKTLKKTTNFTSSKPVLLVAESVVLSLTWASPKMLDVDLLLLHARGFSDQTGVVVGVSVRGTHRVLVVSTAVNVTYAPDRKRGTCLTLIVSLQTPGLLPSASTTVY